MLSKLTKLCYGTIWTSNSWWVTPETWTPRMVLDPNLDPDAPSLYTKLCNHNGQECEFQSTVELSENISCDGICNAGQGAWDGITMPCECSIDEPRTVRIDHSPILGELSSIIVYFLLSSSLSSWILTFFVFVSSSLVWIQKSALRADGLSRKW